MAYYQFSPIRQLLRLSSSLASRVANSEAATARIAGFERSISYHFVTSAGATTIQSVLSFVAAGTLQ
jgi:hypothetical protein